MYFTITETPQTGTELHESATRVKNQWKLASLLSINIEFITPFKETLNNHQ